MNFIDISDVKNYDTVMEIEDLKNYISDKEFNFELWITENPDDEENVYKQEKLDELKEILENFVEGRQVYFINLNHFSEYLQEEVKELYGLPDSILPYINYDKMEEDMVNNYEYFYMDILDQAYYYRNY